MNDDNDDDDDGTCILCLANKLTTYEQLSVVKLRRKNRNCVGQ